MRLRIATIAVLGIGGRAFGQQYPPPFPRDGVSKAVETDRFIVWVGVLGFKSRPSAVHWHSLDEIGVFLDDGGRIRTASARERGQRYRGSSRERRGLSHSAGRCHERLTLAFGEPVLLQDGPAIIVEAVAGTPRIVVVQLK